MKVGNDLEQAVALNMAIGPAAEILRLWGDRVDELRPVIKDELSEALGEFETDDGSIVLPSSSWIVSGRAPAAA
jgi:hypothetical protein